MASLLAPFTFLYVSTYLAKFLGNDLPLMMILSLSHPITCLSIMEMQFFAQETFFIEMKNFSFFVLFKFPLFYAFFLPFGYRTIIASS